VPVPVSVESFARAETDRTFAGLAAEAGGVNRFRHNRTPTPIERQPVIRMNRDTLYSIAIVDISHGATLTIPDAGGRYLSAMIVDQDHYVNRVYHDAGRYELRAAEFDTPYVGVAVRILVDPADEDDAAGVNDLQDKLAIEAPSAKAFSQPDYDTGDLDEIRSALLELARHLGAFEHAFGAKDEVDPIRHLIATAAGWGGLPDREARYIGVEPNLPAASYELTVRDVPVDGFWSISVYNRDGFFEPNDDGAYNVNNLTAARNEDGSITICFGGDNGRPNHLPIMEGWNYTVRLYRPRPEVLDGSWTFPSLETR
jgi:hypothetical protein